MRASTTTVPVTRRMPAAATCRARSSRPASGSCGVRVAPGRALDSAWSSGGEGDRALRRVAAPHREVAAGDEHEVAAQLVALDGAASVHRRLEAEVGTERVEGRGRGPELGRGRRQHELVGVELQQRLAGGAVGHVDVPAAQCVTRTLHHGQRRVRQRSRRGAGRRRRGGRRGRRRWCGGLCGAGGHRCGPRHRGRGDEERTPCPALLLATHSVRLLPVRPGFVAGGSSICSIPEGRALLHRQ